MTDGGNAFSHTPVLFDECMELLNIKPDGFYIDGTLGGAGHAAGILERLGEGGMLLGIDRDSEAVAAGGAKLREVQTKGKFSVVKGNFADMAEFTEGRAPDGILLDIGVSSRQLDSAERGFSYRSDAPLDMRMDRDAEISAYDVVNGRSAEELARILREYGEERYAGMIAAGIVRAREKKPVETTFELAEIVKRSVPAKYLKGEGHPAKRTFQAIRIEVNGELDALKAALESAERILADRGRLVVITFHSLEDRIVKNKFKEWQNPCTCPPDFPVCVCGKRPRGTVVTPHPVSAKSAELETNNRAHSAKARAFEKRSDTKDK